ncbi:MAG: hypothetical protein AB1295_01295 [Candidatus Micrarchaeota archaeon]
MAGRQARLKGELKQQRARGRADSFQEAKGLQEGLSRRSGAFALGRDENGNPQESRLPGSFKMVLDRWYVSMPFKREDRSILDRPWPDAEAAIKKGDVPRSKLRVETHIILAVRMLKHVRQGYQEELERTDDLIERLERADLALTISDTKYSDPTIRSAISALKEADAELARKQVAIKKLVSRGRMAKMVSMLEGALKLPEESRAMEVGRACAVLVSVINRLGQWRDKQVGNLMEYNLQKECSLRVERDRWLFGYLTRLAEDTAQMHWYWAMDGDKVSVLDEIDRMLRSNVPKEQILSFMTENHHLFRVAGRKRDAAERYVAICEEGIQPTVGINIDYMIGHYAWLYRYVRDDEMPKAASKISHLRLFVNANKPTYVMDELSKNPDGYLGDVIRPMREGVDAFESGVIPVAREWFKDAVDSLRQFVYPSRR